MLGLKHKVFPGINGPNNVLYGFVDDTTIMCISDEPIGITEKVGIHILLGIYGDLGYNGSCREERGSDGKYVTTWTYLPPEDVDWS